MHCPQGIVLDRPSPPPRTIAAPQLSGTPFHELLGDVHPFQRGAPASPCLSLIWTSCPWPLNQTPPSAAAKIARHLQTPLSFQAASKVTKRFQATYVRLQRCQRSHSDIHQRLHPECLHQRAEYPDVVWRHGACRNASPTRTNAQANCPEVHQGGSGTPSSRKARRRPSSISSSTAGIKITRRGLKKQRNTIRSQSTSTCRLILRNGTSMQCFTLSSELVTRVAARSCTTRCALS